MDQPDIVISDHSEQCSISSKETLPFFCSVSVWVCAEMITQSVENISCRKISCCQQSVDFSEIHICYISHSVFSVCEQHRAALWFPFYGCEHWCQQFHNIYLTFLSRSMALSHALHSGQYHPCLNGLFLSSNPMTCCISDPHLHDFVNSSISILIMLLLGARDNQGNTHPSRDRSPGLVICRRLSPSKTGKEPEVGLPFSVDYGPYTPPESVLLR